MSGQSDSDPLFDLAVELNLLTQAKETPAGGRADVEGRLTQAEVEAAAARYGVSVFPFPGSDVWCPTIGGYWRVFAACPGDDINVQNDQQALLVEDSDSPHVLPSWALYRRDPSLRADHLTELVRRDRLAKVKLEPTPRERPSSLSEPS